MSDPAFRCAVASLSRDEPVAGTASTVRAFLLVEHPGSWGEDALRDARLPDGVGEGLRAAAAAAKVRVLLMRRPGRRRPAAGQPVSVIAAYTHPSEPWLERGTVADCREVLDLDLEALRGGRSVGLDRSEEPVYGVCTHGRHDACCAELGRPVAAALAGAHPDHTWEVSHIGGDRFAGNLVVLPHGLYYGRLDPRSALGVAGGHAAGQLDLDHLRGRSGLAMPLQRAEIALRLTLGETRVDAVRFLRRRVDGPLTDAWFAVGGDQWRVQVRSGPGPESRRLTCKALRENPVPVHEVLAVERVDPPTTYS